MLIHYFTPDKKPYRREDNPDKSVEVLLIGEDGNQTFAYYDFNKDEWVCTAYTDINSEFTTGHQGLARNWFDNFKWTYSPLNVKNAFGNPWEGQSYENYKKEVENDVDELIENDLYDIHDWDFELVRKYLMERVENAEQYKSEIAAGAYE